MTNLLTVNMTDALTLVTVSNPNMIMSNMTNTLS